MEEPYRVDDNGTEHFKTKDGYRVEYADGGIGWYNRDWVLHRLDGPAYEWSYGSKDWYINGKHMSEEQFNQWRAKHNPITENRKDNIMQLAMYEKEMQDILDTNPILQAVVDHYWSYMESLVFGPKKGESKYDFVEAILRHAENFGYTDKKKPDLFLQKDFDMYVETRDEGWGEKDEAGLFNEYVSWLVDMLD